MYHDNLVLQICSIISMLFIGLILIATFIPQFEFDEEFEEGTIVRCVLILLLFGTFRGAF